MHIALIESYRNTCSTDCCVFLCFHYCQSTRGILESQRSLDHLRAIGACDGDVMAVREETIPLKAILTPRRERVDRLGEILAVIVTAVSQQQV